MLKHFILPLVILISACSFNNKEESFVNPIFYQPLVPTAYEGWKVIITPTSYYTENRYGFSITDQCTMIENTMIQVSLRCINIFDQEKIDLLKRVRPELNKTQATWTHTFTIWPKEKPSEEYLKNLSEYDRFIAEQFQDEPDKIQLWHTSFYEDETEQSSLSMRYIITPE